MDFLLLLCYNYKYGHRAHSLRDWRKLKKIGQYAGAMFVVFLALVAFCAVAIAVWVTMGIAGASPAPGTAYERELSHNGHPVVDQGFKSFVVSRDASGTFTVSGEKLGGEAVSVSVLVMDEQLNGKQLRSDQGIERSNMLASVGTTLCRTEQTLANAMPCSVIEFAAGQSGRFELTFTPATWLAHPSYTVSVDNASGGSMNIHEPILRKGDA